MSDSIGIDIGTGSVRSYYFDPQTQTETTNVCNIGTYSNPRDDRIKTQSSQEILNAIIEVLPKWVKGVDVPGKNRLRELSALSVAATCSTVVLEKVSVRDKVYLRSFNVDPGNPCLSDKNDIILWMDSRPVSECLFLNLHMPREVLDRVGGRFIPEMGLPKLKWLSNNYGDKNLVVFEMYDWFTHVLVSGCENGLVEYDVGKMSVREEETAIPGYTDNEEASINAKLSASGPVSCLVSQIVGAEFVSEDPHTQCVSQDGPDTANCDRYEDKLSDAMDGSIRGWLKHYLYNVAKISRNIEIGHSGHIDPQNPLPPAGTPVGFVHSSFCLERVLVGHGCIDSYGGWMAVEGLRVSEVSENEEDERGRVSKEDVSGLEEPAEDGRESSDGKALKSQRITPAGQATDKSSAAKSASSDTDSPKKAFSSDSGLPDKTDLSGADFPTKAPAAEFPEKTPITNPHLQQTQTSLPAEDTRSSPSPASLTMIAGTSTCFVVQTKSADKSSEKGTRSVPGVWGPYLQLLRGLSVYTCGQPASGKLYEDLFRRYEVQIADKLGTKPEFADIFQLLEADTQTLEQTHQRPISVILRGFFYYGDKYGNRSPYNDFLMNAMVMDGNNEFGLPSILDTKNFQTLVIHYNLIMEFLALQTRQIADKIATAADVTFSRLIISGLQANNVRFVRLLQTILQVPVEVHAGQHLVARGAALIGEQTLGGSVGGTNKLRQPGEPPASDANGADNSAGAHKCWPPCGRVTCSLFRSERVHSPGPADCTCMSGQDLTRMRRVLSAKYRLLQRFSAAQADFRHEVEHA